MSDVIGLVADVIGIAGAIFAGFAWWQARQTNRKLEAEKARLNRTIPIKLVDGGREIMIPFETKRSDFSRAEVLGRIGMLPTKPGKDGKPVRFSIKYLNNPDFFVQLNQIIEGKGDGVLTIPLEKKEFDQFDLQ